jgi:hypothetical protein
MKKTTINRRNFITKTSVAAAGISLGLNVKSAKGILSPGPNDKIRIGFIGGTNLRILHQIQRFSEDLDFDCVLPCMSCCKSINFT